MKDYIELETLVAPNTWEMRKYKTLHRQWQPGGQKSVTVRFNVNGALDVTYGPGCAFEWVGDIKASNSPLPGYGTPDQLRASLNQPRGLRFIDHLGDEYTAHVIEYKERSLTPKWDSPLNSFFFTVKMVGK